MTSTFRFELEPELALRRERRDEARARLAEALARADAAHEELTRLRSEKAETEQRLARATEELSGARASMHPAFRDHLQFVDALRIAAGDLESREVGLTRAWERECAEVATRTSRVDELTNEAMLLERLRDEQRQAFAAAREREIEEERDRDAVLRGGHR